MKYWLNLQDLQNKKQKSIFSFSKPLNVRAGTSDQEPPTKSSRPDSKKAYKEDKKDHKATLQTSQSSTHTSTIIPGSC
jgi:hypothetical protein